MEFRDGVRRDEDDAFARDRFEKRGDVPVIARGSDEYSGVK
jgi:hypothetical protein